MPLRSRITGYLCGILILTSPMSVYASSMHQYAKGYEKKVSTSDVAKALWEEVEDTHFAKRVEDMYDEVRQYGRIQLMDENAKVEVDVEDAEPLSSKMNYSTNASGEEETPEKRESEDTLSLDLLESKPSLDISTEHIDGIIEAVPLKGGVECEFSNATLNEKLWFDFGMHLEYHDEEGFCSGLKLEYSF